MASSSASGAASGGASGAASGAVPGGASGAGQASAGGGGEPVYLSDLSRCEPGGVLSRKPRRNHWRLLDYETEAFEGVMLVAGRNTAAPEIRLPVAQKGWHAISFGLRSYGEGTEATKLEVKLAGDSAFSMMRHHHGSEEQLDDYYWRTLELSGSDSIVFRQFCRHVVPERDDSLGNPCAGVWLAYVKLVPLSSEQATAIERERRGGPSLAKTRTLYCHNDAWSYTYSYRPTSAAGIRREIEPFRDTDFSRIYWEAGMGDRMYYPTKLGRITAADDWIDDPYRVGDRLAKETWQSWRRQGIDPLKVASEHAHAIGLGFHATYRPSGFHFPVPQDEWNEGGLYDQHPEWRGRDRLDQPTPRLSYAFEGVRQATLGYLREITGYSVDGVCFAYNRRPPYLEYEQPLIDGYRAKYGQDPRRLDAKNPRWLKFRATFMTKFMAEVRAMLGEVGAQKGLGTPLELSAIVLSSEEENLYYGLDLEEWVRQGLVDTLMPYSSVRGINSRKDSWVDPTEAEFFYRITKGTACKLALNLMPRQLSPDQYRERALRLYQAGSEHLFFWDTNARNDFSPSWDVLRRLGHRQELEAWDRAGRPKHQAPGSKLHKLGDWNLNYETPG